MKYVFLEDCGEWKIALYIPNDSLPKHKLVCEVYNQNDDEEESIDSDPSGKMDTVIDQFRHDYPTLAQLAIQAMIKTVGVLGEPARGPEIRLPNDPSLTPYPQD